jgi:hypothetical protein
MQRLLFPYLLFLILFLTFGCTKNKRIKVDLLSEFEITPTYIVAGGYIVEYGRDDLETRGICYGLFPDPTIDNGFVTDTSQMEDRLFSCVLDNLISDTTYYLRAFAQEKSGKVYYSTEAEIRTEYTVGSPGPSGGLVFYVNGSGGGLEVAPVDQATSTAWGCQGVSVDAAQNAAIYYGAGNTVAILSMCSDISTAAKICDDFVMNGYADWYLPSLDELSLINLNVVKHNKGDFEPADLYWSSTEQNQDRAWLYLFGTNSKIDEIKSAQARVRAVRIF